MQARRLLLTSICIFICTICWGQEGFYVGLKGGYNNASLQSEPLSGSIETKSFHAWNIGLLYSHCFQQVPVGFTTEIGYTLKGTQTNINSLSYRFDYISVPLSIDLYVFEKIKLSVGPEFSYLGKANNIKNDSTTVSILDTYNKRWELSGSVALSYSISFFSDIGIKYNRSFTNVSNRDAILNRKNLYNQYFQVFLLLKIAN